MKQQSTILKIAGVLALATAVIVISCKKDKSSDTGQTNQTQAASLSVGSSTSQSLYDDAFDVVLQDGESNGVAGRGEGVSNVESCAIVTLSPADPAVFPKTMTIDFGTGCTSANGIVRKGKIVATMSGRIRTSGTTISVSFVNYYVNAFKVEGSYSITNNGGTGLNFTTTTTGGKITYPDGTTYFTYSGTHTLAQTAGAGTTTFTDDSFSITGNSSTSSSAGNTLTTNISTALVKNAGCLNIVAGVEQFTYNALSGSINFGDGTCDKLAVLTIGQYTQTIILPR